MSLCFFCKVKISSIAPRVPPSLGTSAFLMFHCLFMIDVCWVFFNCSTFFKLFFLPSSPPYRADSTSLFLFTFRPYRRQTNHSDALDLQQSYFFDSRFKFIKRPNEAQVGTVCQNCPGVAQIILLCYFGDDLTPSRILLLLEFDIT